MENVNEIRKRHNDEVRNYYKTHPEAYERHKAHMRDYWRKHRDELIRKKKEYYVKNHDEIRKNGLLKSIGKKRENTGERCITRNLSLIRNGLSITARFLACL